MERSVKIYSASHLPDPGCPSNQTAAGGDVAAAVAREFVGLLRLLADLSPGAGVLTIRLVYLPEPKDGDIQSRLRLHLIVESPDPSIARILCQYIECSLISQFYGLTAEARSDIPWERMAAASDIIRRERRIKPLHSREFNDRIPSFYYAIDPFRPNDRNDYYSLESVLGGLDEPVVIDLRVEPADSSDAFHAHTGYLARLQSINRTWEADEDLRLGEMTFSGVGRESRIPAPEVLRPLRRKDPLADDVFRRQQRFHESATQPHLRFQIRVFAASGPTAHLASASLAECAFTDGSYQILNYARGDAFFRQALESARGMTSTA